MKKSSNLSLLHISMTDFLFDCYSIVFIYYSYTTYLHNDKIYMCVYMYMYIFRDEYIFQHELGCLLSIDIYYTLVL